MEKTMRIATILLLAATACLYACSTAAPKSSAAPPPFECTSIHPEVCELEEQFHKLRHEQAEQNTAIEAAERKRRAQVRTAGTVAANAVPAT
jgi:Spy/CpxP family protein refolding chaperone